MKLLMKTSLLLPALLIVMAALVVSQARAATVSWGGGTGDWNTPANWSTGALPSPDDDVVIDRPGEITVTHSSGTHAVKSIQSQEGFVLSGGSLTVSGTIQLNNTFTLSGGTLVHATVTASGGAQLVVNGGTLDGITLAADVSITGGGTLRIANNLTLVGGATITLNPAPLGSFEATYLAFNGGTQTITGAGQIVFGDYPTIFGTSAPTYWLMLGELGVGTPAVLTLGPGVTIRGKGGQGGIGGYAGSTLDNQGTIQADVASQRPIEVSNVGLINTGTLIATNGGALSIRSLIWSNTGTIAANGSSLTFGGTWVNSGTIQAIDSAVSLEGTFTQADLGRFNRTGGTVNVSGTLTGGLGLDAATGSWVLDRRGVIKGGTVTASGGSRLIANDGTFDGVTLASDIHISGGGLLRIANDLTLVGGATVTLDPAPIGGFELTYLALTGGTQTITGTGQIVFGDYPTIPNTGAPTCWFYLGEPGIGTPAVLTLGPGVTIRGKGGQGGIGGYAGSTLDNQGTIQADVASQRPIEISNVGFTNTGTLIATNGGVLSIRSPMWSNTGTIAANGSALTFGGTWVNSGTILAIDSAVSLEGAFTQADLGRFNRTGGTVNLSGTLTGGLGLDAATGSWVLDRGTIKGGFVTASGGAQLVATSGTLDGVTLASDLLLSNGTLHVLNGLTLANNAILTMNYTGAARATLIFSGGGQILGGIGQLVFNGDSFNSGNFDLIQVESPATTVTIGSGITVRSGSGNGYLTATAAGAKIINQGVISAELPGRAIYFQSQAGTNEAVLRIAAGAILDASLSLNLTGLSRVESQAGSTLRIGGSLSGDTTDKELSSLPGTTVFNGSGTALSPQFVEAMSQDFGPVSTGFVNNFVYGTLALANSTYVRLVDLSDNATGVGAEALYAHSVIVPAGSTLDLNGLRVYTRAAQINGTVLGNSLSQIPDGGDITLGTPTAGNITVSGELDEWTFFGRAGNSATVLVDLTVGNVASPVLEYAEVRLLDQNGAVVAREVNTLPRQSVVLADILLPVDGNYRIQVRAPANQVASTGNYLVSVWRVTPDVSPLILNQTHNGRIETPFSVDRWTFSAVAGQQVRFDLVNASASGVAFTLRGPNGWIGFTNLVNDSDLVTLPQSGAYTLAGFATGGSYDINYAFRLAETVQVDLTVGTTFTGQFVGSGQAQLFRIALPGDRPFRVSLANTGQNNRVELYTGFGLPPTRGSFALADSQGIAASRGLVADTAYPGTHYILVYGDNITTPGDYTLIIQSADIFLTKLSPSQSGNGGTCIIEIEGVGFRSDATVRLEGNGLSLTSNKKTWISSKKIIAEFNLGTVSSNSYQIAVSQGAASAGLPFEVKGAVGPRFQADLIMPTGVGLNTVSTFFVEYANSGDLPMVAPLLAVRADPWNWSSAWRGAAKFSLEAPTVARDFWSASNPSVSRDVVTFYASGRIPGILLPGESARIPVYFLGIQPVRVPGVVFQPGPPPNSRIIGWRVVEVLQSSLPPNSGFNVKLLQCLPPSVLNAGSLPAQPDQPLNWQALRTNIPPSIDPGAWDAIWSNFTNAAGATAYSFFEMQQQSVDYLYRLGVLNTTVNNVDDLLAFEVAQADGIHMLRTLATATDGYAPTPSVRLSFERGFPNTISGRYRMGALGRGWSHNWEEHLSKDQFGDVTIFGQGGFKRTFKPDVRGGYSSDPGDYGQLLSLPGGAFSLREKGGLTKQFSPDGKLNFLGDPNGNRITCGYTGDLLTRLAHSSGQRLDLSYNAQGHLETITDTIGRTTRFAYDASGEHVVTAEYYDGRVLHYQYSLGNGAQREHALTQIEFPDHSHKFFGYNPQGRLHTLNGDDNTELMAYAYDNAGTVFAIDALGHTTKFFFDNRALLVRMENPKGEVVQIRHDERFNLSGVTDPAGRSFDYSYDRQGNLTEIVNPLGQRTQFAYEAQFQRLIQLTDAKGNPTRYNYDDRGNLRGVTYANGKSENWGYDAIGNPTTWTNRRRNDIEYQFNPTNGFLMAKLYPDGSRADYDYDARGNLTGASNYTGRITLDYFATNDRLRRITYPGNRWLDYTYDNAGRRQTMTDQLGYRLDYDYDGIGRLRSMTNSTTTRIVLYEYDAAGRLGQKTLANGVYTTYSYDLAGRLATLTNSLATHSVLSFFSYAYDERGRRTQAATHIGVWVYEYDDLSQLTHAVLASADPQIPDQDLTYVYDALGNRIRAIENGATTAYAGNNLNQYTKVSESTYVFDADGNLNEQIASQGSQTLSYDPENRLIGVAQGTNDWEYAYDALGNRVATTKNGAVTEDVIDLIGLGNLVGEYDGAGNLIARYDHGLGLESRSDLGGNWAGYTFDAIGLWAQNLVGPLKLNGLR